MRNIITISREFGAYGGTIGKAVAKELGFYYCDKDIIIRSAIESGTLSPNEVRRYDEKVPFEFGFGQSLFDFYNKPLDQKIYEANRNAIIKVAEKGNCVIVGRNANSILQQFDRTLHVFVSATEYFKLQHMRNEMPDCTDDQIIERMRSVDKARKRFCSYHTDTEFGNAKYYDLCIKSSTLGVEKCIELICSFT